MSSKRSDPGKKKPLRIKAGSVEVKIYSDTNRGRPRFTVAYYDSSGGRRREFFPTLEKAKIAAQVAAGKISQGELDVLKLTN